MDVFVVDYDHKYGTDVLAYSSHEAALQGVCSLIAENLHEVHEDETAYQIGKLINAKKYQEAFSLWEQYMEQNEWRESMSIRQVGVLDGETPQVDLARYENCRQYFRVEYDLNYTGGDYDKVGKFTHLPTDELENLTVQELFKRETGVNPIHIVSYNVDELYDVDGEPWEL
jgi:hypothetical protein